MKRFIAAVAAVLVLGVIGFGLAAQTGQASTTATRGHALLPAPGYYEGVDSHHRRITFKYDGQQMHHFHVSHRLIGGAHVKSHDSSWDRTCHGGYCTSGRWISDTQVHGTWDPGSTSHHAAYHAHWRRGL